MTVAEINAQSADRIAGRYGPALLERTSFRGDQLLTFGRDDVHEAIRWTRDALGYDMLIDLCTVDNMGNDPRFEVVYTLTQAETGSNLIFKTKINDGESVPTVSDLYQAANWHEREAWDMMGIRFEGHPDLRRILMWEGYPYYPLRKEFPVEGKPTELEGVAFSEAAPTDGEPFSTIPCDGPAAAREPRSRQDV